MDNLIRKFLFFILPFPWNVKTSILEYSDAIFEVSYSTDSIYISMLDSGPRHPCLPPECIPTANWPSMVLSLDYKCECTNTSFEDYDDPSFLYINLSMLIRGKWRSYSSTFITNNWYYLRDIRSEEVDICCIDTPNDFLKTKDFCGNNYTSLTTLSVVEIKTIINDFVSSRTNVTVTGNIDDFELFVNSPFSGACDPPIACHDGTLTISLFQDNILITQLITSYVDTSALFAYVTSNSTITSLGLDPSLITAFNQIKSLLFGDLITIDVRTDELYSFNCGYSLIIKAHNCPGDCAAGSGWYLSPGTVVPGIPSDFVIAPPGPTSNIVLASILFAKLNNPALDLLVSDGAFQIVGGTEPIILTFEECVCDYDFVVEDC